MIEPLLPKVERRARHPGRKRHGKMSDEDRQTFFALLTPPAKTA